LFEDVEGSCGGCQLRRVEEGDWVEGFALGDLLDWSSLDLGFHLRNGTSWRLGDGIGIFVGGTDVEVR
jgi:hypothetical protein